MHDLGLVGMYESDSAHVGCEVIDLKNSAGCAQTISLVTQVKKFEFLSPCLLVLRELDVNAANPVSPFD